MTNWIAASTEGEKWSAAFVPDIDLRYANGRNTDHWLAEHNAM